MDISNSIAYFNRAKKCIPGGVNSPVRSFNSVGGNPIFFKKAASSVLYDVDDNQYIDYVASWGPMIFGHAHPKVVRAIKESVNNSSSFGAPSKIEVDIAELIIEMVPNIDKIRMVNSGTEACMSAIRVARGYTDRDKVIKFEGCYHGHADSFLIKAGSGASTLGTPNSQGVTEGTAQDTLMAEYNNIDSVNELFVNYPEQIAAIIVEPVAGNMGCIPPEKGFLQGLRNLCDKHRSVLIFDEVMTGFRLSKGGAQAFYGVNADIVTLGKIIGGGMPVGAYGGKQEIMALVSPDGPVYQAGTLSGNPVAMAAGYTMLNMINQTNDLYQELELKGQYLEAGLQEVLTNKNIDFTINRVGSMISLHFTDQKVTNFSSAASCNNDTFKAFFHNMLNEGIYLPPSPFETWFLSYSLTKEQLDKTISSVDKVCN